MNMSFGDNLFTVLYKHEMKKSIKRKQHAGAGCIETNVKHLQKILFAMTLFYLIWCRNEMRNWNRKKNGKRRKINFSLSRRQWTVFTLNSVIIMLLVNEYMLHFIVQCHALLMTVKCPNQQISQGMIALIVRRCSILHACEWIIFEMHTLAGIFLDFTLKNSFIYFSSFDPWKLNENFIKLPQGNFPFCTQHTTCNNCHE